MFPPSSELVVLQHLVHDRKCSIIVLGYAMHNPILHSSYLYISTMVTMDQGVRVANLVRELNIGIETVCDRRKPKYAINRTILDKNFHKQLILRMYWQRKA